MAARIYNWEEWFRRGRFELRRGRDFSIPSKLMAQQIRNAAQRHRPGRWCRIRRFRDDEHGDLLVVEVRERGPVLGR